MKFIPHLILLFTFSSLAFGGGHTGNGGGTVHCLGMKPLILDYYEDHKEEDHYIPLEKMRRAQFIMEIIARLQKSQESKKRTDFVPQNIVDIFNEITEKKGPVEKWVVVKPLRIHDEALQEKLPENCEFKQAAYSNIREGKYQSYQVLEVTKELSSGQKLVLELHEALQTIQLRQMYQGIVLSSYSVREFVRTLIKKNVSYQELRLAYARFMNPTNSIVWDKKDIKIVEYGTNHPWYRYSGAYILNKSKSSLNCEQFIAFGPINTSHYILYRFSVNEMGTHMEQEFFKNDLSSENLIKTEMLYIEDIRYQYLTLFKNDPDKLECQYQAAGYKYEIYSLANNLFPLIPVPEFQMIFHAKNLIQHFADKDMGLESPFEKDVARLLQYMDFKNFHP